MSSMSTVMKIRVSGLSSFGDGVHILLSLIVELNRTQWEASGLWNQPGWMYSLDDDELCSPEYVTSSGRETQCPSE